MLPFTEDSAPHESSIEAYGVGLRIRSNRPELVTRMEGLLPPVWKRCDPYEDQYLFGMMAEPDGSYSVFRGEVCISTGQGLDLSLAVVEGVVRGQVAEDAVGLIFVHSGAVAHEGRAIIFPGHSFSGKTTITAAMVRAGATYLSDEFAVLDEQGNVHPFAKPLSIREHPERMQVDHSVESLGGVAGDEALPLGLIVVTNFVPGATWDPVKLGPADAALALLANTVPARTRPAESMKAIRNAVQGAVTLQGDRGEADEVAAQLLETARAA